MKVRLVLFVSALLAVFSLGAASAFASGDDAILPGSQFRLNPYTLEPGCYRADRITDVDSHILVNKNWSASEEAHITVEDGSAFSVDQVLVPSPIDGYKVVNDFSTGNETADPDIDPGQTATDLTSPTRFVDDHDIVICVSRHDASAQNEPYVQAPNGEVAATNRPILKPTVASIGLSPIGNLHTFKIGFGYSTQSWYQNPNSLSDPVFPLTLTDPQIFGPFSHNDPQFVEVDARPDQAGVRRVNDIDVAGEQYSAFDADTADHGQVQVFRKAGDPYSFCVAPDNCGGSLGVGHLLAFDAQGDLPMSWAVKASLAPASYKRSVTFTEDDFIAWYKSWQAYLSGKGPKPTLPLAPGTNPPAPDPNLTLLTQVTGGGTTATTTTTTIIQPVGSANGARSAGGSAKKASKTSIRSARVVATKQGKRLVVFVKSTKQTARIKIRMYDAKGHLVRQVTKTVRTNRSVKVSGVAGKVKTVKVSLA
jgi:hypothetical protein